MLHTSSLSLPMPTCDLRASSLELGHPASPTRDSARGEIRFSQVPVEPQLSVCSCSPTPVGRRHLTSSDAHVLPPLIQRRRLRRQYCRGSMAWLPDSLSTLRGAGHPNTTQDSLSAAGRALPDGNCTRKGSSERFHSQLLIEFLLSRASWRNERLQ